MIETDEAPVGEVAERIAQHVHEHGPQHYPELLAGLGLERDGVTDNAMRLLGTTGTLVPSTAGDWSSPW